MKKQAAAVIALVGVMFFFSIGSWPQEGRGMGRLTGVVNDENNNPIEGVKITLEYLGVSQKKDTVSNKKGQWSLLGLGKGTAKLTAEKEGYLAFVGQLAVSGVAANPRQEITMKRIENIQPGTAAGNESLEIFTKAAALFDERKFEAALALLLDFREKQPALYKVGIKIGNCYLELQQFDEAIREFQAVAEKITAETLDVKGNKELAQIYASIGDTYMRQNKLDEAMELFKKSIEIDPSDHALPYNVAEILFAAGNTDDAIKYYQLTIRINPAWPKAYMQLGYAYLNKGESPAAVENLKKFLELDPDSPDAPGVNEVIKSLK